ncbi:MAG: hypothetical protein HXY21_12215 [Parvularculaceae bacterium]|nr:hypothetical protein [Parvularculaceae bacterium]
MCFSATASFTAAGGLALIGAAALRERPQPRMAALAATPLLFAAHQAIEGAIWLQLAAGGPSPALVKTWLFIAEAFWPIFVPAAVLLMTRGRRRRQGLAALLLTGLVVSAHFTMLLIRSDFTVAEVNGNLRYEASAPPGDRLAGLYLLATVAPLLIARERFVFAFGLAVLGGAIVTELYFRHAGPSVWCFFATIASLCAFLAVRDENASRRTFDPPRPGL